MPLDAGTRLGPYEIVAPLGQGGMGEVYRARDTRLDRAVAIKVLPAALANDSELRARFDREARAISSLHHPNICALFDVGEWPVGDAAPIQFLVLEYLEGETLAERLARNGALPAAEGLRIAIEICAALDKAHRSGIVHRDLKPANVFLSRGGRNASASVAKLLDFGLAKTATPVVSTTGLSLLPTTPPNLTAQGTILGTFQYMPPEQLEGLEADGRSDIFAFGAVLFEMLTGRTAFEGKTRAALLGSILKDDPPPVSSLQPDVPTAIDRIVATCLEKDPDDRWQSARDLLRELKWAATSESTPVTALPEPRSSSSRGLWSLAAIGVIAAAVGGYVLGVSRRTPVAEESLQFTIPAPASATFTTPPGGGTGVAPQLAVSPDGKHVVFVAQRDRTFGLWVRALNSIESRLIPGTEGGAYPFWAPDSRTIGFFADGKLKKVAIAGGPVVVLCDAPQGRGGTWNRSNVIVFTPSTAGGLQRVSASGGTPTDVSTLDSDYGETNHRFPTFLPDGRHYLFTASVGTCCPATKSARVRVGALDTATSTLLLDVESVVAYSRDHLLFNRNGTLMAQPFDASSLELGGEPFPILEGVSSEGSRYASFSTSLGGVLVYAQGTMQPMGTLTWFDRSGKQLGTVGEANTFLNLDLSPDERTVAAAFADGVNANREIWLFDAKTAASSRFTFDSGEDHSPVWSPDSQRIAFLNVTRSTANIRQKAVRSASVDEALLEHAAGAGVVTPNDWSTDGRYLLYVQSLVGPGASSDIWALPLFGEREPFAYINSPAPETDASFSPDQRWVAYQLTENGQPEIFVQPFPATGGKFQISRGGGVKPVWRRDGKELLFLELTGRLMSVAVSTVGGFEAGVPQPLFTFPSLGFGATGRQFDVTADGQRLIMNVRRQGTSSAALIVSTNWLALVQ